jgi:hypothetical protein
VLRVVLLLTKGLIRDPIARRKMMFWLVLVALVMLFAGSVFISDQWVRAHPWLTMGYWAVCAWLTLCVMLLAVLDILVIRAAHRAAQRAMEKQLMEEQRKSKE